MGAACSSEPTTNSQGKTQRASAAPGAGAVATRFQAIRDRFESTEEVQDALRQAGLESSDLIVAIDLTKSNEWSGKASFGGAQLSLVATGLSSMMLLMRASSRCQTRLVPDSASGRARTARSNLLRATAQHSARKERCATYHREITRPGNLLSATKCTDRLH